MVTFVYAGNNPFLRSCAEAMKGIGMEVEIKEVPRDIAHRHSADEVKKFVGDLKGVVVTDITLEGDVKEIIGRAPLNAYQTLEWRDTEVEDVVKKVGSIRDEIQAKGKIPVVLQKWLRDHTHRLLSEEAQRELEKELEKELEDDWCCYSFILKKLNMPIIRRRDFDYDHGRNCLEGNILDTLKSLDISPEKAVLLVDHHVYDLKGDIFDRSGFKEVEIVPICPCCIGQKKTYKGKLEASGFRIFPLEYKEERGEVLEKLKEMIANY